MSLILLLNPKQYGGEIAVPDLSDVWYKKRKYDELEERIAAQLLAKQRQDVEIPENVDKNILADVLTDKLLESPKQGEVAGLKRKRIITALLMVLALESE